MEGLATRRVVHFPLPPVDESTGGERSPALIVKGRVKWQKACFCASVRKCATRPLRLRSSFALAVSLRFSVRGALEIEHLRREQVCSKRFFFVSAPRTVGLLLKVQAGAPRRI